MFASGIYFFVRLVLLQMYPVYACFKAIKHDDQRQFLPLLIYWITATTFLVLEYFANIAFFWVPFYPEAKLLLVLWITLPQTKGAIVLYADFIEPFLLKHEAHIDKTLVEVQDNTKKTITVYGKGFIRLIGRVVTEMLRKVRLLMAEEAVSHPEADATATASSSSSSAPQMTSAWEGYIYAAFWSIMNRGSQLTAALQTAAQAQVVSNATSAVGTQNTTNGATPPSGNSSPTDATTEATEDEGAKLERSESYDSLGSFIASRRTVASGSSSKVSQPVNNDTTSWSAYLSGFVWSNAKAAKASSSSTKVEKTD